MQDAKRTDSVGLDANDTITAQQVELINAYGPYTHATWIANGLNISNEEQLSGRGEFILSRIRESISKHFSMDEITTLSILDVGCYNGWLLHQLSDLPFARMVGIEPREKNIVKGQKVREILNINSRVEFRVGDIESLGTEVFDIVLCTGVLHHVESTATALRLLRSVCRKLLFIETISLSSKHISKGFRKEIEMKDLVYLYKSKTAGLTGQKFESSYYDGSTDKLRVVSIPSVESLMMYMDILGFDTIEIAADPKTYRSALRETKRPFNAVCICALVNTASGETTSDEWAWVKDYEDGLARTILPREYIEPLYQTFCLGSAGLPRRLSSLNTFLYLRLPHWLAGLFGLMIRVWHKDRYAIEIIRNLRYNPADKLSLEYGKLLYHEQDHQGAIPVLKAVTQKVNADWRSVYRSFSLLSRAYRKLSMPEEAERYKPLCLTSNPHFPIIT